MLRYSVICVICVSFALFINITPKINPIKNKIDTIVKIQNISIDNNLRLKAVNKKIIIEDNDYKKLSKETKELITGFNVILFE